MKNSLVNSWFYKNRSLVGFVAVSIIFYYFICINFARLPAGLSQPEIQSLVLSGNFNFPESIIDLPYHFLQWLSVSLLGISNFSIRLVSVILALLSGLLIVGSIKNLIKNNVAIITGLIIASSVFFLDFARLGAPMIMSIFLFSLAIYAVSQYIASPKPKTAWLAVAVATIALGLYSPLGIYFLIASGIFAIAHPKTRLLIAKLKTWQKVVLSSILVVAIIPIVVAIIFDSSLLLEFLGADGLKVLPADIWYNIQSLFAPTSLPQNGFVTPFVNFAELILMVAGVITLCRNRQAVRSYVFLGLGLVTLILAILDVTKSYLFFLPMTFLIAFGVQEIIRRWYDIFPLNPYARFVGLIPIFIFICSLVVSNHLHFNNSSLYDKNVIYDRNQVLMTAKTEVNKLSAHSVNLVVSEPEVSLYKLLEHEYPNLKVQTKIDRSVDTNILIPSTFNLTDNPPNLVKTSSSLNNNVLIKIYQK